MKILQSASASFEWGGMEIYILNLCTALQERGHEVVITCPPESFVDKEAQARGIRTVPINNRRREYDKAFLSYCRLMQKERFDAVHAHNSKTFRSALMAAWLYRVPARVKTFHSTEAIKALSPNFLCNHVATQMLAVSENTRQQQIQRGIPAQRCAVLHNSIDAGKFHQRVDRGKVAAYREAWGSGRTPLIGFAGRIVPEKGWSDFVRAIALVPDVNAVVIGDGYDCEKLHSLVAELGLTERLRYARFISDMPNAFAALDIFVLPSTYEEPCATVVLEAMAMGLPVIGTRRGGTPEMIENEKTGLVVSHNAPEEIANAIQTLITDAQQAKKMGTAGRERVETIFAHKIMVEKIEKLYQQ
jgi:glycosyltransferase involved in cell wall biosynthesis